jgi:hypothetical protein
VVRAESATATATVMMVGDGVNDAPGLFTRATKKELLAAEAACTSREART